VLVLTRKVGERIVIGDDIVVTVLDARRDGVRIGIEAPRGIRIQRHEILQAVSESNVAASQANPDAADLIKAQLGLAADPVPGTDASQPEN
jgi:carbon storage regulator